MPKYARSIPVLIPDEHASALAVVQGSQSVGDSQLQSNESSTLSLSEKNTMKTRFFPDSSETLESQSKSIIHDFSLRPGPSYESPPESAEEEIPSPASSRASYTNYMLGAIMKVVSKVHSTVSSTHRSAPNPQGGGGKQTGVTKVQKKTRSKSSRKSKGISFLTKATKKSKKAKVLNFRNAPATEKNAAAKPRGTPLQVSLGYDQISNEAPLESPAQSSTGNADDLLSRLDIWARFLGSLVAARPKSNYSAEFESQYDGLKKNIESGQFCLTLVDQVWAYEKFWSLSKTISDASLERLFLHSIKLLGMKL